MRISFCEYIRTQFVIMNYKAFFSNRYGFEKKNRGNQKPIPYLRIKRGGDIISYQKFKALDLTIFCILAAISEFLSYFLLGKLTSSIYISFGTLIFIVASIRWGRMSFLVLLVSSIPIVFIAKIPFLESFVYYVLANLFAAIPIFCYGKRNRDVFHKSNGALLIYLVIVFLCLILGKGLALLWMSDMKVGFRSYLGSVLLTFVIDIIILLVLNRKKIELIVDMDQYLEKMSKGEVYGQ